MVQAIATAGRDPCRHGKGVLEDILQQSRRGVVEAAAAAAMGEEDQREGLGAAHWETAVASCPSEVLAS